MEKKDLILQDSFAYSEEFVYCCRPYGREYVNRVSVFASFPVGTSSYDAVDSLIERLQALRDSYREAGKYPLTN